MKFPCFFALFAAAISLAAPSQVQAFATNGSWNVTISPAAGGTKTAVSFFATGDFTTGFSWGLPGPQTGGAPIAFTGQLGSPAGAWSFATNTFFSVPQFGYATNITTGTSRVFDGLGFFPEGDMAALLDSSLAVTNNDTIAYVLDSSPVSVELDVAFSNFTPGTYNAVFPTGALYNMEVVPEPSTYALLALSAAGLGGHVLRRRRK